MKGKVNVTLDTFEHDVLINGFNAYRNILIKEKKPTEDVDSILMKLIEAPVVKEKRHTGHEER